MKHYSNDDLVRALKKKQTNFDRMSLKELMQYAKDHEYTGYTTISKVKLQTLLSLPQTQTLRYRTYDYLMNTVIKEINLDLDTLDSHTKNTLVWILSCHYKTQKSQYGYDLAL